MSSAGWDRAERSPTDRFSRPLPAAGPLIDLTLQGPDLDEVPRDLTIEGARVEIRALWGRVMDLEQEVVELRQLIWRLRTDVQIHG